MIARIIRGRGFGGTVRYCAEKAVGERPLGSSVHSEDPNGPSEREVIYHLRSVTSARDAARPVVHIPIRTRDGEHLSEEQWLAVAERVRVELGFENCPWAAYLHDNEGGREGQHLHLVVSRVSFDGKIVSDRNDRFRVTEIMRVLELELGLEPVLAGERTRPRSYPHDAEGRAQDREFIMLRAQIDAAGANARTIRGLVERLEAAGVQAHLKISSNGHLQGASFQLKGSERIWKGSALGRSYSIGRIVERFALALEGELLRAHEVSPRELQQLRSMGLEPDRVESLSGGRLTAGWVLVGNPSEQDLFQKWVQQALPGRLCERSAGADVAWSREVPASVLEGRRQQIEAVLNGHRPAMPAAVPLGPQGLLQAHELRPRELQQLRSMGLEPDRVESLSGGRLTAGWVLVGNPSEQDLFQKWVQQALPGRLCERSAGADVAWSREVPASVLEGRRQQIEAVLNGPRPATPTAVPLLSEGPQGLREAGRQVEALLARYSRDLRAGESAERLSATWLEILRWTGVRGVRPEALERRGLGQQLAGLGSIAQTPNAVRSRLLRGGRGYVSIPLVRGELTHFPPHLLETSRGPEHREFNRRAHQIVGERESVALLRLADHLGRSLEDRRLRDRLEKRLTEVERAAVFWGATRSGRALRPVETTVTAQAVRRSVSRTLGGRLRQAERGLTHGLMSTVTSLMPRPRLPGLGLLGQVNALMTTANQAAGWAREIGQAVFVIEAAVRREHRRLARRGAHHLGQVASGDVSTYRLLRLTSGHPKAVALLEAPQSPARDLSSAIREYRRSRVELIRLARTSLREGMPWRKAAPRAAQRAAGVLIARERVVNAALAKLGIPSLRMLAGTARDRTEVLFRFAHGCRSAGMSVGTVARVVAEVGPVVLGGVLAGAAVTLTSRLVMRQVFGLGRDLAKEFLYGERDRGR